MKDAIAVTSTSVLRPALDSDINAIADLWHRGWREAHLGHVPARLLRHRSEGDFRRLVPPRLDGTIVATIAGDIVGFVVSHRDEIEQLYVDRGARGSGVAAILLSRGESVIARSSNQAWLAVVAGNARARRFYERQGWHDAGPFTYHARVATGAPVPVPVRRYEKQLAAAEERGAVQDMIERSTRRTLRNARGRGTATQGLVASDPDPAMTEGLGNRRKAPEDRRQ